MPPDSPNQPASDAQSVSAVRHGDIERYRELVERHERRVFAVAWSRLGDQAMAEEATQEAFIRGFRRLPLLGDGSKFAGWITSIARHAAINLGLRNRRELNKRDRFALEPFDPTTPSPSTSEATDPCTPETLRQSLEQLSDGHRECLVLFYLDGKSGTEAAATLGISEAAFRVRLHRARGALREHLETKLEDSLQNLRPANSVASSVMMAIIFPPSAKTATAGGIITTGLAAKIIASLGKSFLFAWMVPLVGPLTLLIGGWIGLRVAKADQDNFLDVRGFRAELHRRTVSTQWWKTLLVSGTFMLVIFALVRLGIVVNNFQLYAGGLIGLVFLLEARSLAVCHSPYQLAMLAAYFIMSLGWIAPDLDWLSRSHGQSLNFFGLIWMSLAASGRPRRMDYNLFLRASEGLIGQEPSKLALTPQPKLTSKDLLAFARFLGTRFLVTNYSWEAQGLALRLRPVKETFLTRQGDLLLPAVTPRRSMIRLRPDGTVDAVGCGADAAALAELRPYAVIDLADLEILVGEGMTLAWQEFRVGNFAGAEQCIGDVPESAIFRRPRGKIAITFWTRAALFSFFAIYVALLLFKEHLSNLKPVSLTEAQVKMFAESEFARPTGVQWDRFHAFVVPEKSFSSTETLERFRKQTIRDLPRVIMDPSLKQVIFSGWIDLGDLAWNQIPYISRNPNSYNQPIDLLTRVESWSCVLQEGQTASRFQYASLQDLRWLQFRHGLDSLDREKLISQIASVQVLSGQTKPDQPRLSDWRAVRGLFFTACSPALQDTYCSLRGLEILGGLNQIDREACIRGILRLHNGKGYFSSPQSGGFNEYHVTGDAEDTFCAFEFLRILGALDRVKDLDQWKFRVPTHRRKEASSAITWLDVEAWLCQQRLEKILQERKANPKAPIRSLLEP